MRAGNVRALVRPVLVMAGLTGLGLIAAPTAMADQPFELTQQITDRVGALDGREGEVEDAIRQLAQDHRVDLYVVYVDDFSGMSAERWAAETAARSQLDTNQVLLAVATAGEPGERLYHLDVDQEYPLNDEQLGAIRQTAIQPVLAASDWAGAAIGAAGGLSATLSGREVTTPAITEGEPNPGGGSDFPWAPVVILGAGAAGAGYFLYSRSRRRPRGPDEDPKAMTIEELDKHASSLLINTDDAIKTSDEDLGFARAQFGDEATGRFIAALEESKAHLDESFRLRGKLDDSTPEDAATRRAMLEEIVQRLTKANDALDDQSAAFDQLRDLEKNAPEVLEQVNVRATEARSRLGQTNSTLETLAGRYAASALESVANNGEQTAERLEFVTTASADAREKLTANDRGGAAVATLAAQESVSQAEQLMDAVDRLSNDLDEASRGLQQAVQETAADLTEAKAMLAGGQQSPELASQVAAAEHALTTVQQELSTGRFDPLSAVKRIQDANVSLDDALEGVREENARIARAKASLEQALLGARAEISAANDFITTRRGGVGSEARTRLAEAQRTLTSAVQLAPSDPVGALKRAQHAHEQASRAMQLARGDVGEFNTGLGGIFGGSGGRGGGGMAGAVLGGILIDTMFGGRGGGSGGFGGGMFGGSGGMGGGGGRSPGSYGGLGTRGRRGGGGRF